MLCILRLDSRIDYNSAMFDFAEKRLPEIPVVVIDTETTGLRPAFGHRVVELGAVRLESWEVVAELSEVINPGRDIPADVSAIHNIYNEDVANAPTFEQLMPRLNSFIDGALLVAHNARFDADFLGMEYHIANFRHGLSASLPNPWLCTLTLAREFFHFRRNNLSIIAQSLGVKMGRAHRALSDVYMTMRVLKEMARKLKKRRLETVGDLLYAQGGAIFAPAGIAITLPRTIQDAITNQQNLLLYYQAQQGRTERIVTPAYPTQADGVDYLVAYCHLRKDQRTFRLDRISEMRIA